MTSTWVATPTVLLSVMNFICHGNDQGDDKRGYENPQGKKQRPRGAHRAFRKLYVPVLERENEPGTK